MFRKITNGMPVGNGSGQGVAGAGVGDELGVHLLQESALHIEIYVRHRVDPIKLEKLRGRGISSVEIDLSKLDWGDRRAWDVSILETAPRDWLHNARAAKVSETSNGGAIQD